MNAYVAGDLVSFQWWRGNEERKIARTDENHAYVVVDGRERAFDAQTGEGVDTGGIGWCRIQTPAQKAEDEGRRQLLAKYDIVEFAIRTANGLLDEAFDEHVGPHTAVYTAREDAQQRCNQLKSLGYQHRDATLVGAHVVSRLVTEWSA